MKKFAKEIENDMSFLLSGDLKKSLAADDAVRHLQKARDLLVNAGFETHAEQIEEIIRRAKSIDESQIEVM